MKHFFKVIMPPCLPLHNKFKKTLGERNVKEGRGLKYELQCGKDHFKNPPKSRQALGTLVPRDVRPRVPWMPKETDRRPGNRTIHWLPQHKNPTFVSIPQIIELTFEEFCVIK